VSKGKGKTGAPGGTFPKNFFRKKVCSQNPFCPGNFHKPPFLGWGPPGGGGVKPRGEPRVKKVSPK